MPLAVLLAALLALQQSERCKKRAREAEEDLLVRLWLQDHAAEASISSRGPRGRYAELPDLSKSFFEETILRGERTVRRWLRTTKAQFEKMVDTLQEGGFLEAAATGRPRRVTCKHALGMLLLVMAHGFTEFVVSRLMGVSEGTVCGMVRDTLEQLLTLYPRFVQMPDGDDAERIAQGFAALRRGMPTLDNVAGSVDGTFVFVSVPVAEKGKFIGYKHARAALLLMAACDHNMKFMWADVSHVASVGDQAATTASSLATASTVSRADRDHAADEFLGPVMAESITDAQQEEACRSVEKHAGAEHVAEGVPVGYVFVCDGGVREYPWLLNVGSDHDIKAMKREDGGVGQRAVLEKLEYLNFVISSHRIHIERAFGRLFNSWKVLRGGRYRRETMELFTMAAIVMHNFIIEDLEIAEGAAAAASASASTPALAAPCPLSLTEDVGEYDHAVLDRLAVELPGVFAGPASLASGEPVMALVHSEASKATVDYIKNAVASGEPLIRPGAGVTVPDTGLRLAEARAAGPPTPVYKEWRARRRLLMELVDEARNNVFDDTGVWDAQKKISEAAFANLSASARKAERAACI